MTEYGCSAPRRSKASVPSSYHTCAVTAVVAVACTVVGVVRPAAKRPTAAVQKDVFIGVVRVALFCSTVVDEKVGK